MDGNGQALNGGQGAGPRRFKWDYTLLNFPQDNQGRREVYLWFRGRLRRLAHVNTLLHPLDIVALDSDMAQRGLTYPLSNSTSLEAELLREWLAVDGNAAYHAALPALERRGLVNELVKLFHDCMRVVRDKFSRKGWMVGQDYGYKGPLINGPRIHFHPDGLVAIARHPAVTPYIQAVAGDRMVVRQGYHVAAAIPGPVAGVMVHVPNLAHVVHDQHLVPNLAQPPTGFTQAAANTGPGLPGAMTLDPSVVIAPGGP